MEEQTVTSIPNPTFSKDKLFKISLIIIGLLIVIGLFGNIYLLLKKQTPPVVFYTEQSRSATPVPTQVLATPTTDITANWKTYTNNNVGFLFKYPDKYLPKSRTDGVGLALVDGNKEIEKIFIEKDFVGGWACTQAVSSEEIYIDGEKSKLITHATMLAEDNCSKIDPNGSRFAVVLLNHKGVTWFFHYDIEKNLETEEIAEFKNILSTFKFLP